LTVDKRRKRIGVMNRLILIYPDQGEALNQFFLVIKKAKEEGRRKRKKGRFFLFPLSPSPPLPLSHYSLIVDPPHCIIMQ